MFSNTWRSLGLINILYPIIFTYSYLEKNKKYQILLLTKKLSLI